ncbi:DUF982 domain-containing protein [Phyllobacterium brassicacearum]|nr:DUF982 domain-containing protein [Phyllobacterium brassicacearum]
MAVRLRSQRRAVAFLLSEWPGKRGRLHGLARQACLEALEGNVAGDLARTAFVDAAREADIYKGAGHAKRGIVYPTCKMR